MTLKPYAKSISAVLLFIGAAFNFKTNSVDILFGRFWSDPNFEMGGVLTNCFKGATTATQVIGSCGRLPGGLNVMSHLCISLCICIRICLSNPGEQI